MHRRTRHTTHNTLIVERVPWVAHRGAGGRWQQEEVEAAVMDRMLSDRDVYDADPSQPKPQDAEPNRASLLSDEQRAALQVALEGVSFFFTGSAGALPFSLSSSPSSSILFSPTLTATGTGKSFLLKEMITQLRRKHREGIFVTASTVRTRTLTASICVFATRQHSNEFVLHVPCVCVCVSLFVSCVVLSIVCGQGVAACNIGGVTLHGFAGVGLANGSAESLASQVANAKWTLARWRSAKVGADPPVIPLLLLCD